MPPRTPPACWSCATPVALLEGDASALTCAACGVVLQPDPQATPFARLGLPLRFDVEDQQLERAWLLRSSKVHPDRFVKKTDRERRFAVEQTAALNDAKRAIQDLFDRASWLVRHGGIVDGPLDQRLLMSLMEARERAEESASDKQAVVDESVARYRVLASSLAPLLISVDDKPSLAKAARALAEMKTLARLVADLRGPHLIATLDGR